MIKAAPLLLLALVACARDDAVYPSLAERPAEKRGFAEPETAPPVAARPDPALDAQVIELGRTLAGVGAGFDRDAERTRAAAARVGAKTIGSDAWLDAQTALAGLDDWRAQAAELTTDAEQLAGARAAELAVPYPPLEELRRAAAAETAREDAAIRAIAASLPAA